MEEYYSPLEQAIISEFSRRGFKFEERIIQPSASGLDIVCVGIQSSKLHQMSYFYVERGTYAVPVQIYTVLSHDLIFAPEDKDDFRIIVHHPFFVSGFASEYQDERVQHFYIGLLIKNRGGDVGFWHSFLYSLQSDDSTKPFGDHYPQPLGNYYPYAGKDHLGYVDGRLIMKVEFASVSGGIERFVELVGAKLREQKVVWKK